MHASSSSLAKAFAPSRGGTIGLSLRLKWGDQRVGDYFLRSGEARTFSVGAEKGVDFAMGTRPLGAPRFELVRSDADGFFVRFSERMSGTLDRRGERVALADAGDGTGEVMLEPGDVARVELGAITAEAELSRVPQVPPATLADSVDYTSLNVAAVLFFIGMLGALSAHFRDEQAADDDATGRDAVLKKVIARQAPLSVTRPVALVPTPVDVEPSAAAHSGKAGEAGRRNAPDRQTRAANAGQHPGNSAREIANRLFAGPGGVAAVLGPMGPDGELTAAIGKLTAPVVGDALGLGGMAPKGDGPGGGGLDGATTIGINLHTNGHGPGRGGPEFGLGKLPPGTQIIPDVGGGQVFGCGDANGQPCLDKELIRKVIHQHRDQLRFCYELGLQRNQSLSGKVSVAFTIGAGGLVADAAVAGSDLREPAVESCVVSRLRAWVFPRVPAGWVKVTYPFVFKPAGQ